MSAAAAIVFAVVAAGAIGFQLALALGAPWGAYAMGGAYHGRFPPPLRLAALIQALLLAVLALGVLSRAGLVDMPVVRDLPWLVWAAAAFSAVSLVLNAVSRSPGERRIWVPVAIVMLGSSLIVAVSGG